MITILDTIRGISEWIEKNFGEPPITKDLTEGFDRPCTYVGPVDIAVSQESLLKWEEMSFEIIRFAPSSYAGYKDLLQYQATLSDLLLKPIPVSETFFLYPENVEFEVDRDEMLLIATFDIDNMQLVSDESESSALMMEELELEQREVD